MLALGLAGSTALAQGGGAKPAASTVTLEASSIDATYEQSSANSALGASDTSDSVAVQGTDVRLGASVAGWTLGLGIASLEGEDDTYYGTRRASSVDLGRRLPFFPQLTLSVGAMQVKQTSDRARSDAPIAFIDDTRLLRFGAQVELVPLAVGAHGLDVMLRYVHLTSGESDRNFGDERGAGIGYVYRNGGFQIGLRAGVSRTFLNASRVTTETQDDGTDAEVERRARGILDGRAITLFVGF
jgi:hypothetical protein